MQATVGAEELADVRALRGLDAATRQELIAAGSATRLAAGTTVFREGDAGSALYVLLEGRIAIRKLTANDSFEIAQLRPPTIFGELALFDGAPRSASAIAETDCRVLSVPREALRTFCRRHPELYEAFLEKLARRLRQTSRKLVTLDEG